MCADSGWRNHMDQSPPLVSIWHLTGQEQFALGMPSMLKRDSTRCHHFNFAHVTCDAHIAVPFGQKLGGGGYFWSDLSVAYWFSCEWFTVILLDFLNVWTPLFSLYMPMIVACTFGGGGGGGGLVPCTCNFKQGILSIPPWITTSVLSLW